MAAVSLTMIKPIALAVIAILASSVISIGVSTIPMGGQQGQEGPQGPQGPYLQDYYSGWINITDKTGQYITLDHDLITMMFLQIGNFTLPFLCPLLSSRLRICLLFLHIRGSWENSWLPGMDLSRPCDACGKPIGGGYSYCSKCKIFLCMLCAIKLIDLQKKYPTECPMCGTKLE